MASTVYSAAVDLGATSGRVILGAWSRNRLTLQEVHRFPNALRSAGGHDYWDIPGLWHEIQTGLRKAAAALPRGAKLASVGVDTWGVDYVLLNDEGRLVFPVHAYRDVRTQPGFKRLENTRAANDRIYAATGIPNFFLNSSLHLRPEARDVPVIVSAGRAQGVGEAVDFPEREPALRPRAEHHPAAGGTEIDRGAVNGFRRGHFYFLTTDCTDGHGSNQGRLTTNAH